MPRSWGIRVLLVETALLALACGSTPEVTTPNGSAGNSSSGTGGRTSGSGGGLIDVPGDAGGGGAPSEGGAPGTGCALVTCDLGQRCVETGATTDCEDVTCDDLDCSATEECQPAPTSGSFCKSIACDSDVDCTDARYCNGSVCVDDVCEPASRSCDGNQVQICPSNGGASEPAYVCEGGGYFSSECSAQAGSSASATGCTCEGEWDCPEYTTCEAGVCVGTGVEPSCTLPPTPFEEVLPKLEFRWGGTAANQPNATGKAFPWSSQVTSLPVVINLDDDNGDGFINELDFPEIVFMTYHGGSPELNGVVRAIHGGGPNKGQDYFALCGTRLWSEGEAAATDCNPATNGDDREAALGRAGGAVAAGDLDGDGSPELVVPLETGGIQILDHRGQIVGTSAASLWPSVSGTGDWRYPAPAIANIDFEGLAEVVVGNRVLKLTKDATSGTFSVERVFTGQLTNGTMHNGNDEEHHGPAVCLADLTNNPGLELVAGTTLYRLPDVANCAAQPNSDYCLNRLTAVWNARAANPGSTFYQEGFCAVADVLGEDPAAAPGPGNPLDQLAEVLVVVDGRLLILKGDDGSVLRNLPLGGGNQGGAPNIDDFDGDGFPEIAIALSDFYTVLDLQDPNATNCPAWPDLLRQAQDSPGANPERTPGDTCTRNADCNAGAVCNTRAGQCVCLHSGWKRDTEDDSSKVTSSSVFDFNGDGAAEVVYNDECYFRIYDGASGSQYLALPSLSRTIIENPVVADVDNDGNAEIVFVQNNETRQCGDVDDATGNRGFLNSWPDGVDDVALTSLPNGVEVWGDPSDVWVSARRVWNQHSYHVTNVTEGGSIPLHEPESFKPLNGRLYNTYRSQPRNYGVAPDLTPTAIQITSPNVACGELSDEIEIAVQIRNIGDLRVGPGVELAFDGTWENPDLSAPLEDINGDPIRITLTQSLEPGASTIITVPYVAGSNGRDDLPLEIRAVIDAGMAERECKEDNNEISSLVAPGEELADLRLVINSARNCSPPTARVTLYNDGAAAAENILVRIYAGDPSQGGQVLGETTIAGPLAPGESEAVDIELTDLSRDVVLYGIADPANAITECNDANNVVMGPALACEPIAR